MARRAARRSRRAPVRADEISRLEEQRLAALELRIEADLAAGRHAELVGELGQLTRRHPWRERLPRSSCSRFTAAAARPTRSTPIGPPARRWSGSWASSRAPTSRTSTARSSSRTRCSRSRRSRRRSLSPAQPRRRRRRALGLAAAGALAVVVVVAVLAAGGDDRPADVQVPANAVAVIDEDSGRVARAIPVGEGPGPVAVADGAVWVLNVGSETVTRIDPRTRRVVRTEGIGDGPANLAGAGGEAYLIASCEFGGAPGRWCTCTPRRSPTTRSAAATSSRSRA